MAVKEKSGVRGFFRVKIVNQDGSLHGDSGWRENEITNLGYQDYLCNLLGGQAASKFVNCIAIGTGTAPGAAATSLPNELGGSSRRATGANFSVAVSSDSKQVEFKGTFSSNGAVTTQSTLQNIGLFHTTNGGTLFAGNTYTTSTCDSNQAVNVTYKISFGTTT